MKYNIWKITPDLDYTLSKLAEAEERVSLQSLERQTILNTTILPSLRYLISILEILKREKGDLFTELNGDPVIWAQIKSNPSFSKTFLMTENKENEDESNSTYKIGEDLRNKDFRFFKMGDRFPHLKQKLYVFKKESLEGLTGKEFKFAEKKMRILVNLCLVRDVLVSLGETSNEKEDKRKVKTLNADCKFRISRFI